MEFRYLSSIQLEGNSSVILCVYDEIRTYEARLEAKATERIEIEYRRFQKAQAAQLSNREGGI